VTIPHSCYDFSFENGITLNEQVAVWLKEKGYVYHMGNHTTQEDRREWRITPYLDFYHPSEAAEFKLVWG
jgi:hypothetical protein